MEKIEALKLIDEHKNALINPVAMLNWTWLRVIILNLEEEAWEASLEKSVRTMER